MVATYLLERRRALLNRRAPENLALAASLLGVALVAVSHHTAPLAFLLFTFAFGYATWQMWRFSSLWVELRHGQGLEELACTPASLTAMVDEVARYSVLRCLKVVAPPVLTVVGLGLFEDPRLALGALLFFVALGFSLSYTVQAWCSWSGLAWYWSIVGIPLAYDLLVVAPVGFANVALWWLDLPGWVPPVMLGMAVFSVAFPRWLALAGLRRRGGLGELLRSRGRRQATGLLPVNDVTARLSAPYVNGRARAVVAVFLLSTAVVAAEVTRDLLRSPSSAAQEGLFAMLGGVATLFGVAGLLTYFQVHKEHRTGSLDLVLLTRLTPRQLVDGWALWGMLAPLGLLLAVTPAALWGGLGADCLARAALVLATGPILIAVGAYLGVAAARPESWPVFLPVVMGGLFFWAALTEYTPTGIPPLGLAVFFAYALGCLPLARKAAVDAYRA